MSWHRYNSATDVAVDARRTHRHLRPGFTFIGTAEVNAATAKMRLVQTAEEIISVLGSDPQANVKVCVEVSAEFPQGVTDQVKRTVSENATSLGFKNKAWE